MKRNRKLLGENSLVHGRMYWYDHPLQGNTKAMYYAESYSGKVLHKFGYLSRITGEIMCLFLIDGTFTIDKNRKISVPDKRLKVTSPTLKKEREFIRRIQMEAER